MIFLILFLSLFTAFGETTLSGGQMNVGNRTVSWEAPVFILQGGCRGIRTDNRGDGIFGASRGGGRHDGVDWYAPLGTTLLSPWSGVVEASHPNGGGGAGDFIQIRHHNGLTTTYAHLQRRFVRVGQQVSAGTPIGTVGNTGNARNSAIHPHIHFTVRYRNRPINPTQPGFFRCQSYSASSVPSERTAGVPVCTTATNCP